MNPVCPYCRTEIGTAEGERTDCPGCGTPHHTDCYQENGGCTVFGCVNAPVDEPKISLSGSDIAGPPLRREPPVPTGLGLSGISFAPVATAVVDSPAAPPAPTPPPPHVAGVSGSPPPPRPRVVATQDSLAHFYPTAKPKTRVVFVLLGLVLGMFGVHNFYGGYVKKGAIQLLITLFGLVFYGWVISWIWAVVEICIISEDSDGNRFA